MDWITRLNSTIEYIEKNITEDIDYNQLGKIACCSPYHFQKMFGYMADMTLSEYIRKRKMSLAAADLQDGKHKIIDIAAKYGYDSPTAFNRAFQSVHGFAPSLAKETGRILKSFPPISFQITIKGATQMDYRIEKKESFRILGISISLDQKIENNFKTVPKFWNRAASDGTISQLCSKMNSIPKGVMGISTCDNSIDKWRYYIGVSSTEDAENFEVYNIPELTWAIFSSQGAGITIQELEKRIVTDWLPTSGYEYANGPDVELYLDPTPENTQYEVWIPVIKK